MFNTYAAQLFTVRRELGQLAEMEPLMAVGVADNPGLIAFRAGLTVAWTDLGRPAEAAASSTCWPPTTSRSCRATELHLDAGTAQRDDRGGRRREVAPAGRRAVGPRRTPRGRRRRHRVLRRGRPVPRHARGVRRRR